MSETSELFARALTLLQLANSIEVCSENSAMDEACLLVLQESIILLRQIEETLQRSVEAGRR